MKIARMSDENTAPEWAFNQKQAGEYFEKETLGNEELQRLASMSCEISDNELVVERDRIEICASSKKPYYCNAQWPSSVKSELKEYASVCGMDMSKFKAVDPSIFVEKITVATSDSNMIKIASAETTSDLVVDAFKIDDKIATSHEKSKWHPELKDASKLADKPSMNGIIPIRGGEDYFANSESKVAQGQNSISDPNAIGKLADSITEDTGARLKRENAEKEASKKTKHEEWQKEKIEAMEGKDILPNRYVFPTESLNAQPGIRGEVFDYSKMPEKTAGEQLKQASEERREKIRGKEKAKHEFALCKNPTLDISENFSNELKKHLGQMD